MSLKNHLIHFLWTNSFEILGFSLFINFDIIVLYKLLLFSNIRNRPKIVSCFQRKCYIVKISFIKNKFNAARKSVVVKESMHFNEHQKSFSTFFMGECCPSSWLLFFLNEFWYCYFMKNIHVFKRKKSGQKKLCFQRKC